MCGPGDPGAAHPVERRPEAVQPQRAARHLDDLALHQDVRLGAHFGPRLVVVELVALPRRLRRDVGHHDVAAVENPAHAAVGVQRIQRRRRRDVDVLHDEARRRDHVEGELEQRRLLHHPLRGHVGPEARDVGTHADHVGVEHLERADVVLEVFERLAGKPDHDAGADLVARAAKVPERLVAVLQDLLKAPRGRMERVKERGVRRFDAKEVAEAPRVPAGFGPTFVDLERLLAEGERDAEAVREGVRRRLRVDAAQHALDESDPLLVAALARLDGDRAVALFGRMEGAPHDHVFIQRVARDGLVALADAAVAAVRRADVAHLDEPPQVHVRAHALRRQRVGAFLKLAAVLGVGEPQKRHDLLVREIVLHKNSFKILRHPRALR